jgi:ubiquinone/menaquinone biosynthesis C-methylase UbiE
MQNEQDLVPLLPRSLIPNTGLVTGDIMAKEMHTTKVWADILREQATFTREYRHNLYNKVDIQSKEPILDVGCGTGAITADIAALVKGTITGIDIDDKKLEYAKVLVPRNVTLLRGNVLNLPFSNNTFDLVVFNIILMYIQDQEKAVKEMARVTKKSGIVLATMEPDYAGELCYPENKARLHWLHYMEDKGVDIEAGRKLKYLFRKAGLKSEIGVCDITMGLINRNSGTQLKEFLECFPSTKALLLKVGWTNQEIEEYKKEGIEIMKNDLGFSFVPGFYAIGKKV